MHSELPSDSRPGGALSAEGASRRFYFHAGRLFAGPLGSVAPLCAAVRAELGEEEVEELSASAAAARWPQLRLGALEEVAYFRKGYVLGASVALDALLWAAEAAGAHVHHDEGVVSIDRDRRVVRTESGAELGYSTLVLCAGPWTNRLLERAQLRLLPLVVSNEQTLEFAEAAPEAEEGAEGRRYATGTASCAYGLPNFPLFSWSEAGYKGVTTSGGCRYFYSVPQLSACETGGVSTRGLKVGFNRQGTLLANDDFVLSAAGRAAAARLPHVRKEWAAERVDEIDEWSAAETTAFVRRTLPGLSPSPVHMMRCLYQNTPDLQMFLGPHPDDAAVLVACGFSGNGFQFAPAIGEYIALLCTTGGGGEHVSERAKDGTKGDAENDAMDDAKDGARANSVSAAVRRDAEWIRRRYSLTRFDHLHEQ